MSFNIKDNSRAFNMIKITRFKNKIHDDTCQKRTIATIATHDLKQINTKLFYEAADPNSIQVYIYI